MHKIITDIKITGALRMFRLHITNTYHLCFMRNTSFFNGNKGYSIELMKKGSEQGTYQPVFKRA